MDKEREDTGAENLIYLSYEEIIGLLKKQDPEALKMQTGIREFSYDLRRKGYKKLEIIGHIEPYYGRGWAEVLREEL